MNQRIGNACEYINSLVKGAGINAPRVRHWARCGLLGDIPRPLGTQRFLCKENMKRLTQTTVLRMARFSLPQIALFLTGDLVMLKMVGDRFKEDKLKHLRRLAIDDNNTSQDRPEAA